MLPDRLLTVLLVAVDTARQERLAALGRPPYDRWEDDLALADLERSLFLPTRIPDETA